MQNNGQEGEREKDGSTLIVHLNLQIVNPKNPCLNEMESDLNIGAEVDLKDTFKSGSWCFFLLYSKFIIVQSNELQL